jgi:uncharacterized protein (TIGR02246 family)
MRTLRFFASVSALPIFLYGCQPAAEPSHEEAAPAAMTDEEMIGSIGDHFEQGWASGDAKALGALFADDGDSVGADGQMAHGREAVESRYRELLDGPYKGTSISITTTSTRMLEPAVAIVDGTYQISGMKSADGIEMPAMKGLFTNVSVKHGDHWMIHCSRPMLPVKAPGT